VDKKIRINITRYLALVLDQVWYQSQVDQELNHMLIWICIIVGIEC
jgi:hypothetical protein